LTLDNVPTSWYVRSMSRKQPSSANASGSSRQKLLDAALSLIRTQGYAATTVDDLCAAAGVTKGAFFHHFASKEALAVAAADHCSETTSAIFAAAPYHQHDDPLDRVLGYLDFRKSMIAGRPSEFTCLVGTMAQEVYETYPLIRKACEDSITGHVGKVESDITEAMKKYRIRARWTAKSLALHTQAVPQGAFVLAKAQGDTAVAKESIDHLRRYIESQFRGANSKGEPK
jgi:TetR/AcrR family transcriptional repressor of nem operon